MAQPWSDEENAATVHVYLDMLEQELAHQKINKAERQRGLQKRFGRSMGAYAHKFMNISSVLRDLHLLYIDGYKPEGNRQKSLEAEVRKQLIARDGFLDLMERTVDHPAVERADIVWNHMAPPTNLTLHTPHVHPQGVHVDFVAREAANRSLGKAGEIAVVARERAMLVEAGRSDLAARVRHASIEEGDGLGFDIHSWTSDGMERLIEVKTTRRAAHWPMIVTRNEVAVSHDHPDTYVLARVFAFAADRVGLYELPGPIDETCALEPMAFQALPKPA